MAVQKLSQIAAAGAPPAITDQAVFVIGGVTDNLVTVTQLGAGLPVFTSTVRGQVPASGGVATTFLNGAGAFTTPSGVPGGSALQIQYQINATTFGGANVWRTGVNQLDLSNSANAQQLRVYNSTDNNGGAPTNSSFAVVDAGIIIAGVVTIGSQNTGGGSAENINLVSAGPNMIWNFSGGTSTTGSFWHSPGGGQVVFAATNDAILLGPTQIGLTNQPINWTSGGGVAGIVAQDTGLSRVAAKVLSATDGTTNAAGWVQTQGMQRIGSDVGYTSTTVLTQIMSAALQAGRTYSFDVYLSITGSTGGVQAAMVAAGGLTATDIRYDGYVVDNAAAGTKGAAQASALGTAVANPATITGPASAVIRGTITVNNAGTISIQASQASNSTITTTVKRGSYAWIWDMP